MADLKRYKLGKNPVVYDDRTLMFSKYLKLEIFPPIPQTRNWGTNVSDWGMMLNGPSESTLAPPGGLGDCVPAEAGHSIMGWTSNAKGLIVPGNDEILKAYEAVGGYVPGDPSTDNGCDMLSMMKFMRKTGIAGVTIKAFASLRTPPLNTAWVEAQQSIDLFGGVALGLAMPISAQSQDTEWTVPAEGPVGDGAPNSWGGHCVLGIGYTLDGILVVSWGMIILATWNFLHYYCDESYAVLSQAWMYKKDWAPSGFDMVQLEKDLSSY